MIRLLALAALMVSLVLLVEPTPSQAALKSTWGATQLQDGSSTFPLYRRLGVDVWQRAIAWSDISKRRPSDPRNPNDEAYLWPGTLDRAVTEAAANGVDVALQVSFTPRWANGGKPANFAPQSDADYADFVIAAARRYPSVRFWMIWGEPSRKESFSPMPKNERVGPERYARLLDTAYGALKAENPDNTVIGAMTFTVGDVKPRDFTKWMRLPNGKPPRLDWWGHNPYSRRFPRLSDPVVRAGTRDFNDLDILVEEVRRAYRVYGQRPPLWLSEFSIQTDHASDTFDFWTTHKGQAQWLREAYRVADRHEWISGLGWFEAFDQPHDSRSENWGFLTDTGKRKPAYSAFFNAPSKRFRPEVSAPPSAKRSELSTGLPITVTPKASGGVHVSLTSRDDEIVLDETLAGSRSVPLTATLRASGVPRGKYTLTVRAPRGERVVLPLAIL